VVMKKNQDKKKPTMVLIKVDPEKGLTDDQIRDVFAELGLPYVEGGDGEGGKDEPEPPD
jgi:hypothetical protein